MQQSTHSVAFTDSCNHKTNYLTKEDKRDI